MMTLDISDADMPVDGDVMLLIVQMTIPESAVATLSHLSSWSRYFLPAADTLKQHWCQNLDSVCNSAQTTEP